MHVNRVVFLTEQVPVDMYQLVMVTIAEGNLIPHVCPDFGTRNDLVVRTSMPVTNNAPTRLQRRRLGRISSNDS